MRCDQNQLKRLAGQDALKRRSKLLKRIMNSRNDDRDVVVGKGWLARDRLRLVGPMADAVNKQPGISMEPSMRCQFDIKSRRPNPRGEAKQLTTESKRHMSRMLRTAKNQAR